MPQRVIHQIVVNRARSKDYVKKRIVKIVDARDPDVYFGVTIEPWPPMPTAGHIPTAKSLPTPWLWNLNLDASGTVVIYAEEMRRKYL